MCSVLTNRLMILSIVRGILRVSVYMCARSTCEKLCKQEGERQSLPSPPYSWTSRYRHWKDSSQTSWFSVVSYTETKSINKCHDEFNATMFLCTQLHTLWNVIEITTGSWSHCQCNWLKALWACIILATTLQNCIFFSTTKFCSFNVIWFRDQIYALALSILLISQGAEGLCPKVRCLSLFFLFPFSCKPLFCLFNFCNIFNVKKARDKDHCLSK